MKKAQYTLISELQSAIQKSSIMKNNELKCSNFTDEMLGELADIKFGKSHFSYKNEAGDMDFVRLGNFSVLMCNAFDEGDQPVYFAIYLGKDDQFHCYIPKEGNTFNAHYSCAYGKESVVDANLSENQMKSIKQDVASGFFAKENVSKMMDDICNNISCEDHDEQSQVVIDDGEISVTTFTKDEQEYIDECSARKVDGIIWKVNVCRPQISVFESIGIDNFFYTERDAFQFFASVVSATFNAEEMRSIFANQYNKDDNGNTFIDCLKERDFEVVDKAAVSMSSVNIK